MERYEELATAIRNRDAETSLKLLEDAGGACQARDLAKAASKSAADDFKVGIVNYSIGLHDNGTKETLELYLADRGTKNGKVVSIEQDACRLKAYDATEH